ncbi:hypothetical protein P7C70_g2681, partial [Phenoliferia sp. Uapishka_3]
MVQHFSSKLSHFAPSFRPPQPTFSFTRNAFPPAPPPPGPSAYGSANALKENQNHAPGQGAHGNAGAGGGNKWHAGRAPGWGFQPHTRLVAQPPANPDPNSRLNDEEDLEAALSRSHFLSNHTPTFPTRRSSVSLDSLPSAPLLNADEAGLSSVRLSSVEMQERYRLAFSRGEKTPEVKEMEIEADEMDLGPRRVTRSNSRGRSASVAGARFLSVSSTNVGQARALSSTRQLPQQQARGVHSSAAASVTEPAPSAATPFSINSSPPTPTVPRVRRKSTSAVDASLPPNERSSPPIADLSKVQFRSHVPVGRPPSNSPNDRNRLHALGNATTHQDPAIEALHAARRSGNYSAAERAVRSYRAVESSWSTTSHNLAMDALLSTRPKGSTITPILELYNHLFSRDNLKPTVKSYDLIIKAFVAKDRDNADQQRYLENRITKKKSAMAALGKWADGIDGNDFALDSVRNSFLSLALARGCRTNEHCQLKEVEALEVLKGEDYFTPALQIYTALGRTGDAFKASLVNQLLGRASLRNRVDVALALFGRLEKSPLQRPNRLSYQHLLTLYSREKDAEGVMTVFEAYLDARRNGLPTEPVTSHVERNIRLGGAKKHNHTTEATWAKVTIPSETSTRYPQGDAAIWSAAIDGLFECGQTVEGVALLDRLLAAQVSPETLSPGYPEATHFAIFNAVVRGFLKNGDAQSAKIWFDKVTDPGHSTAPRRDFYESAIYAILSREDAEPMVPFLFHIYRQLLALAGPGYTVSMAEFVSVTDYALVAVNGSKDEGFKKATLAAIVELRSTFKAAVQQGFHDDGFGPKDPFSSGFLTRLISAFGTAGNYSESVKLVKELSSTIKAVQSKQYSQETWALKGTRPLPAALGHEPIIGSNGRIIFSAVAIIPGLPRPTLRQAITVTQAGRRLVDPLGWDLPFALEHCVVERYLAERAEAQGNFSALGLSPEQWFEVVRSFAAVAAHQARGISPLFDFPGFEPIVDDFFSSGVKFEEGNNNAYGELAKTLGNAGFAKQRITAIVSVLDPWMAKAIEQGLPLEDAISESGITASVAAESFAAPLSQADAQSIAEVESVADTIVETVSPSSRLSSAPSATTPITPPPSSPPTYLRDLPETPATSAGALDSHVSDRVSDLAYQHKLQLAFKYSVEQSQLGKFAHPEAICLIIDGLGREGGKMDQVRQLYLVAYDALALVSSGPEAQSHAWWALENHMIVALAQAGLLDEVAIHRLRLLHSGMAPSADAYAAMILNMKETTNDAAVALELFEESQRHGVAANVYLFNTLISKLSRARRAREALEYFDLMKESGVVPTSITYGAIINACCKTGDDVSAEMLFKEMVEAPGFRARVPPYNTMIQFYTQTKPDRERALAFYDAMRAKAVVPTGHTYKLLLDAYGSVGVPDGPSLGAIFAALVKDRNVTVTGAHWASLINSWGSVSKDLERARSIFNSIATHPSTTANSNLPDAVVYEALLNACIANGRSDLCNEYLQDMKNKGIHITAYVANTVIKAYIAQGDIAAARTFFESMTDPPVGVAAPGNKATDRHPKHHHQAGQTPVALADEPIYREPSSYEIMIRSEIEAGEMGRAAALLSRVEERAFPEAVVNRLRHLLTEHGLEPAAVPTTSSPSPSATTPSPSP